MQLIGRILIFPDQEAEIIADNGESLLVNLARAFRWQAMIEEGTYQNAAELAKATNRSQESIARILRLTLLSPKIVHAIVTDTLPGNITARTFRHGVPSTWSEQNKLAGLE